MSASRGDTGSASRTIRSDLAKVDAYENSAADYDDLPEVTEEEFARAKFHRNGVPAQPIETRVVEFRIDSDVMEHLIGWYGEDWQQAANDQLRSGLEDNLRGKLRPRD